MRNISITGDLGSGKSTVAKQLCGQLGFEYFSTGRIQRQIAAERGIDTLQLNQACNNDKSVDDLIDGKLRQMNEDGTADTIFDSRLAWFFVNKSFKIYLTALPAVAAERVFHDDKRTSEPDGTQEQVLNNLLERQKVENERFKNFYNADCFNLNNYDLIVDTSYSSVEEISGLIIKVFKDSENGIVSPRMWISAKMINARMPEGCKLDERAGLVPVSEWPLK